VKIHNWTTKYHMTFFGWISLDNMASQEIGTRNYVDEP